MVDAPTDGFSQKSPPGRAFLDGDEVQVAVFGGDSNIAVQADRLERHAESMRRAGIEPAPPIESLADHVELTSLPTLVDGLPALGIWDETLAPIGFPATGTFLVSGPPLSGKTTTVASMVQSLARARPDTKLVYLGQRRSPLAGAVGWERSAQGAADIEELAEDLRREVAEAPGSSWAIVVESASLASPSPAPARPFGPRWACCRWWAAHFNPTAGPRSTTTWSSIEISLEALREVCSSTQGGVESV